MKQNDITRRSFLKYCSAIAGTLCLDASFVPRIARALTSDNRPPVVWLHFSECTACSESFLRSADPGVASILLDTISLDYHETLMAASGAQAEANLYGTVAKHPGEFICVVEGAIPTADNGIYGMIGGRTMLSIAEEVIPQAKAVVCMGTCASYGGLPAAGPNPTGAKGVGAALGIAAVNIPGCPPNPFNLVSAIVNYLLFNKLPQCDSLGRPLFAYKETVHEDCPKPFGCLEDMRCRGKQCRNNCHQVKFNNGRSWDVQAGHHCIGCSEPNFWDKFAPFYSSGGMAEYYDEFGFIGNVRGDGGRDDHEEEEDDDDEKEERREYEHEHDD